MKLLFFLRFFSFPHTDSEPAAGVKANLTKTVRPRLHPGSYLHSWPSCTWGLFSYQVTQSPALADCGRCFSMYCNRQCRRTVGPVSARSNDGRRERCQVVGLLMNVNSLTIISLPTVCGRLRRSDSRITTISQTHLQSTTWFYPYNMEVILEKFNEPVGRYHVEDSKTLPCLKAV
jgi:hypothetical protein